MELHRSSSSRMSAMQSTFGVIILPFLLTVYLSFQPVAGQDLQHTCGTCATCYQTLADALVNAKNRYNLTRGFFPPDDAPPVLVKATYHFENCSNCTSKTWYWTEGAFYIYQPLQVFVFRSLFFSHISILHESVELQLPAECFDAKPQFFELLTQRLKAYAMFQTATPHVDNMYYAKAVSGDTKLDYKAHEVYGFANNVHIDQLLHAYQYVPFIITFLIVTTAPILLCCLCCSCETIREKISKKVKKTITNSEDQAMIVAIVTLCSCTTVYIFILDMISLGKEDDHDLPTYYEKNKGIYVYTIIFALFSLLFFIAGVIWFILLLCVWFCKEEQTTNIEQHGTDNKDVEKQENEKLYFALLIPVVMCVGSLVLFLSFHFQNILIAWNTDPFYASRIAVYYGIVIFVYYLTFKNTYMIPLLWKKLNRAAGSSKKVSNEEENTPCEVLLRIICVVIVGVLLSGFHALNVMFIYYIPINNSIEESVHGVQTIYNGAVILIGGLIAYNVGWSFYHSKKFSVKDALKKTMNELEENPFDEKKEEWEVLSAEDRMKKKKEWKKEWEVLSAEDRMKKIVKDLLSYVAKKE